MRAARGFTLVELIVVMLVMGVLAGVALPRLLNRGPLDERAFREQLEMLLHHARQTAVVQRRGVCVLLRAGNPQRAEMVYTTGAAAACNGPTVAMPGTGEPYVTNLPNGIAWAGAQQLRFDAQGRPLANADQVIRIGNQVLRVSRESGYAFTP